MKFQTKYLDCEADNFYNKAIYRHSAPYAIFAFPEDPAD